MLKRLNLAPFGAEPIYSRGMNDLFRSTLTDPHPLPVRPGTVLSRLTLAHGERQVWAPFETLTHCLYEHTPKNRIRARSGQSPIPPRPGTIGRIPRCREWAKT